MIAYIVGALALALSCFGAGYKVASNAADATQLKAEIAAQEKYHEAEIKYNTASVLLEAEKAKQIERARVITREVEKIVDRPIYSNVCLDADGLRIVNSALTNTPNLSEPKSALPSNPTP